MTGHVTTEVTYSTEQYLTLLQTYSPYLKLEPQTRQALLLDLKDCMERDLGGHLALSYLSAFHMARKG